MYAYYTDVSLALNGGGPESRTSPLEAGCTPRVAIACRVIKTFGVLTFGELIRGTIQFSAEYLLTIDTKPTSYTRNIMEDSVNYVYIIPVAILNIIICIGCIICELSPNKTF